MNTLIPLIIVAVLYWEFIGNPLHKTVKEFERDTIKLEKTIQNINNTMDRIVINLDRLDKDIK